MCVIALIASATHFIAVDPNYQSRRQNHSWLGASPFAACIVITTIHGNSSRRLSANEHAARWGSFRSSAIPHARQEMCWSHFVQWTSPETTRFGRIQFKLIRAITAGTRTFSRCFTVSAEVSGWITGILPLMIYQADTLQFFPSKCDTKLCRIRSQLG